MAPARGLVTARSIGETLTVAVALSLASPGAARAEPAASSYALDAVSRDIPAGRMKCPRFDTRRYLGTGVRYASPIFVHSAFVEKLVAFDALVERTAIEVYGRAPEELHHLGGTTCESLNGQRRFSEHAFGNAIDVDSFTFGALGAGERLPAGLPAALAGAFKVSISWHFFSKSPAGRVHSRFLHRLALRLVADRGLFRVVLGPGYGDHWSHFHLDAAPYRFAFVLASGELAR
ncbi:MAG: extensin family protein [Myxococcales bacterium]|jgi:hypothetical protein|nr:extensin family protein [Myxococcales bacterium]MBL0196186.1 extensin family protein [Myxococcales bacterium]HQY63033.1 extensin family protein [Polyangiaceae bacterium]